MSNGQAQPAIRSGIVLDLDGTQANVAENLAAYAQQVKLSKTYADAATSNGKDITPRTVQANEVGTMSVLVGGFRISASSGTPSGGHPGDICLTASGIYENIAGTWTAVAT
jgi:hypothetical protein